MRPYRLLLILAILLTACTPTQATAHPSIKVFYAGPDGGVKTALDLAVQSHTVELVADADSAQVLLLNGQIPNPVQMSARIASGAGLVLIMGADITAEAAATLLEQEVTLAHAAEAVSLTNGPDASDPLLIEVMWNSAPQVRERYKVLVLDGQPLVNAYENSEPILWRASTKTYIVNAFLGEENSQIQEWPYFNYLIYHLTARAAGVTPLLFADYPASPVPHLADRGIILLFLGGIMLVTFSAFAVVKRYSRKHPEALDALIADEERFEAREEGTAWEDIGFHRPLSGLIVGMSLGVVLFIPLIIYQNLILPQFILPSAQAMGIWGRVTQFFGLTWVIFDMGTAAASMKFMAQYRVSDPRRGIKFIQVYVWWQALSGAVQLAFVVMAASTGVVRSPYALYAWSIIIHSLIQIPGFFQVMRNTLNAFQRNDYARYMDTAYSIVVPMIVQPLLVPLFFWWGQQNPQIGGALGGVMGMGAAAYALELLMFLLGLFLYRRIGYKASVLFMAHFDWSTVKEAFRFGIFEMLGGMLGAGGAAAEIWITQTRLINYTEIWGNWAMAQNFVFAFTISTNLFDGVMTAISEAISSGRKLLSQYYSVQSYKWGAIASGFLAAVLLAVAPRFIIGSSGPEFQRAAVYAVPLILWGAIQYPAWLNDSVFLGSNKPFIRALMILGEQTLRISLAVLLLARFQISALIIAYFIALLARGIVGYFISHKICFPQRFFFWQSFGAVVLAAGAHYLLMSLLAAFIWKQDEITSIILFFIGILPSLPFYFFFYGLFGGWDDATLSELKQAIGLTGFLRPFGHAMIYLPNLWGSKISPLHNRFPITIREAALAEARSLTEEKVRLVSAKKD